jgi:hypothetical protein
MGFESVSQWSTESMAGSSPKTAAHRNQGASGSMNRLLHPDSVRHMSVTTATQRPTAAHHETRRDKTEKAREAGYPQLTGRIRRWWQVLGSNQRRLSRRFYIPEGVGRGQGVVCPFFPFPAGVRACRKEGRGQGGGPGWTNDLDAGLSFRLTLAGPGTVWGCGCCAPRAQFVS